MKTGKVQFSISGAGNETALLILPKEYVDKLKLNRENRIVNITCNDNKIIIEKQNSGSE